MKEHIQSPEILPTDEMVKVGSVVEFHFTDEPEDFTEIVQIVGRQDHEIGTFQRASIDSPLASAILGAKVGSIISYEAPDNQKISVKILAIS